MLYFMQPDKFPSHSKLETFRHLPAGWHYGKGGPISADAINRAKHVVDTLAINGFTHTDVFPNEGGEVLVTAYHQEHYLSVTVEEQGYTLNHERAGNDVSFAESLDFPTLSKSLNKIAREIWNMSGFSTRGNMTIPLGASTTSLSLDQAMVSNSAKRTCTATLPSLISVTTAAPRSASTTQCALTTFSIVLVWTTLSAS